MAAVGIVLLAAGCSSAASKSPEASGTPTMPATPPTQAPPTGPSPGQTCNMPGGASDVPGLPMCETQAAQSPPPPTATPDGFQRLTYSHEPGPVPQQASLTLTRDDGVKVGLILDDVQAKGGGQANIGIHALPGNQPKWHTVTAGTTFTEAGYTFHILKIWVMPTASTDAVDLIATPQAGF